MTEFPEKALECASKLLLNPKGLSESRVQMEVVQMLEECGIDSIIEYPLGRLSMDIYSHRHRTVIETKSPGLVSEDNKPQLNNYLRIIAKEEKSRIPEQDDDPPEFTGILTDGKIWYAWKYDRYSGAEMGAIMERFVPNDAHHLLSKVLGCIPSTPYGKPSIPANPINLFKSYVDQLQSIYSNVKESLPSSIHTKKSLWLDLLRTSSMAPSQPVQQEHLFVSHTFLVTLARGVIHAVSHPNIPPNVNELLGDGFIAWLIETEKGREWAEKLLLQIHEYDWTRTKGDVLRPLYENFVGANDRRAFGEFYTPDWLAQFMVEDVLDDDWCKNAVESAIRAKRNPDAIHGVGVLDPSCGSGTFLYFAALRILESSALNAQYLSPEDNAKVVAMLMNGIDVHPVAAEMCRATLMRALIRLPNPSYLHIYEGDSLQIRENMPNQNPQLFTPGENQMVFRSPGGYEVTLPASFIHSTHFAESTRRLVEAALHKKTCPLDIQESVPLADQELIRVAHSMLQTIIDKEKNSVWTWYIVNISGPYQLSQRKVNRIVANPPWVAMKSIQVENRKRTLEAYTQNYTGLWPGGNTAPHFDIAQLFVKRCRELYLKDPKHDPSAWLVKRSAIKTDHWKNFRDTHKDVLKQIIDLYHPNPFEGGDARRCCALFLGRASGLHFSNEPSHLVFADLENSRKRPKPHMKWTEAESLLQFKVMPEPFPVERSDYAESSFKQGATITPKVLTLVSEIIEEDSENDTYKVRTERSMHPPWRDIRSQEGVFPKTWIRFILRSEKLLPFLISPNLDRTIIPMDEANTYIHSVPTNIPSWETLDSIYQEFCGLGKSTPKTLIDRINFQRQISTQLDLHRTSSTRLKTVLVYPGSGDIMRAARMSVGHAIADSTVYRYNAGCENESAFLVGILNASVLESAFAEARNSGRHFSRSPWQKIPIPKYNDANELHRRIAHLTVEAEELITKNLPMIGNGSQKSCSKRIKDLLGQSGIMNQLNQLIQQLLPNHTHR